MASSIIHMAVANEVNNIIKRDRKKLLIGSIAPDISKQLGRTKIVSHFQDTNDDIPNLNKFINKYNNYLSDDFVLGYYIHIYTDYLWFKYFVPDFYNNGVIYKLDGSKAVIDDDKMIEYFYNDYTSLNIKLIDKYNLDLDIFYEKLPVFEDIIKEIPMGKIQLIVDKTGIIIENSKEKKEYIFDMEKVYKFISLSVEYLLSDLKEKNIY